MNDQADILIDAHAALGEGAFWHARAQKLYWIDILGKSLHVYDPATNTDQAMDLCRMPGTVVPRASGGWLLATEDGIGSFDGKTFTVMVNPEKDRPENRFNDGKCDPAGRFWAGTMGRKPQPGMGSLYRLDPDLSIHTMLTNLTISNGIVWTSDARTMYFIDTPTRAVAAFDYDLATGNISNRREVINVSKDFGAPDGMTIDAEDMLWVCHWGSGEVVRWNPKTGQALRRIKTGATQTSSCTFGGANLDKLFITSARDKKEDEPHAGAVFVADPGVKGVVLPESSM